MGAWTWLPGVILGPMGWKPGNGIEGTVLRDGGNSIEGTVLRSIDPANSPAPDLRVCAFLGNALFVVA